MTQVLYLSLLTSLTFLQFFNLHGVDRLSFWSGLVFIERSFSSEAAEALRFLKDFFSFANILYIFFFYSSYTGRLLALSI